MGDEIGKNGKLNEEDFYEINNEDIICTKFKNCSFKNLKFKNCRFIGCTFEDCIFELGGVIFENCTLIKEDTNKYPSLNKKDNLSCSFYNCKMYIKFLNSDISYCIFENCKIDISLFKNLMYILQSVSYTHLTLPTIPFECRSRWSPYH